MDWFTLISTKRWEKPTGSDQARSEFQRDADRIVFSAAFRRLQDKTQVHPFPESDYIRRRLTHSLEVSCVGRSLGTAAGISILAQNPNLETAIPDLPFTIGQIVSNACLAHDIGNPPFGHAGEKAIGSWFDESLPIVLSNDLSPTQLEDLKRFEGNAQGFRLLTRLQDARNNGGLKLTYGTLAAFTKYPTASHNAGKANYVGAKKHGFFEHDVNYFREIAEAVGLPKYEHGWRRHPLVFLVEAADDICYRIIDIEDAFKLNRLNFKDAETLLLEFLPDKAVYKPEDDESENINWLRAKAIGSLIEQVREAFTSKLPFLMDGNFDKPLLESIELFSAIKAAKKGLRSAFLNGKG